MCNKKYNQVKSYLNRIIIYFYNINTDNQNNTMHCINNKIKQI